MTDVIGGAVSSHSSLYTTIPVRSNQEESEELNRSCMTAQLPDKPPMPRLWTIFAAAWLLILVLVVWRLPTAGLTPAHLSGSVACVALLALAYLWLTLRQAPSAADLAAERVGARPEPAAVGALAVMAACVFVFTAFVPGLEIWWLMMFPIVAAGLALAPAVAAVAIAALIVIGFLSAWLTDGRIDTIFLLEATFGASAIAFRYLMAALAQLRRAREDLARAAVAEERLRFARDLHDLLGHSLSTIVLKSELAGRLASRAPDRAAAEIADVERTAREALQQVRAAVAGYRLPSLTKELSAARELLAAAGIDARIDSMPAALPPAADGLLGWAVREGVTNVVRHSRARSCTIRLARRADLATAEIVDDGSGNGGGTGKGGCGLAGLIERAAAEGGNVDAGPIAGGGFRLAIDVPLRVVAGVQR
jgi:two-component system, NarL family, sensor histidine kinase DesK